MDWALGAVGLGPDGGPHSHGDPVGASDVEEGATPRAGRLLLRPQQVPLQEGGPGLGSARVLQRVCGQVGGQRLRPAGASPAVPAPTSAHLHPGPAGSADSGPRPRGCSPLVSHGPSLHMGVPTQNLATSSPGWAPDRPTPSRPCPAAPRQPPQPMWDVSSQHRPAQRPGPIVPSRREGWSPPSGAALGWAGPSSPTGQSWGQVRGEGGGWTGTDVAQGHAQEGGVTMSIMMSWVTPARQG